MRRGVWDYARAGRQRSLREISAELAQRGIHCWEFWSGVKQNLVILDAPLDERTKQSYAHELAWADAGGDPLEQLEMSFASLPLPEYR